MSSSVKNSLLHEKKIDNKLTVYIYSKLKIEKIYEKYITIIHFSLIKTIRKMRNKEREREFNISLHKLHSRATTTTIKETAIK